MEWYGKSVVVVLRFASNNPVKVKWLRVETSCLVAMLMLTCVTCDLCLEREKWVRGFWEGAPRKALYDPPRVEHKPWRPAS